MEPVKLIENFSLVWYDYKKDKMLLSASFMYNGGGPALLFVEKDSDADEFSVETYSLLMDLPTHYLWIGKL